MLSKLNKFSGWQIQNGSFKHVSTREQCGRSKLCGWDSSSKKGWIYEPSVHLFNSLLVFGLQQSKQIHLSLSREKGGVPNPANSHFRHNTLWALCRTYSLLNLLQIKKASKKASRGWVTLEVVWTGPFHLSLPAMTKPYWTIQAFCQEFYLICLYWWSCFVFLTQHCKQYISILVFFF